MSYTADCSHLQLCVCAMFKELDLCRSWMGTVNHGVGVRKLPPVPICLNDVEIEDFGLEAEPYTEEEEEEEEAAEQLIILDSESQEQKDNAKQQKYNAKVDHLEEVVQKYYSGLRVDDMIKVTATGNFYGEDGIVKRLKEGKIMIRFFTYGSTFDHWLEPGDVRKLSDEELLKGLGGAGQPITQRDIDGPRPGERIQYGEGPYGEARPNDSRRNLVSALGGGGGGRDRRQDRTADRFNQDRDNARERDNWNAYKDQQREKQGGGYSDGDVTMRGNDKARNSDFAQGDVDSQWGRPTSQRQQRRDNKDRPLNNPTANRPSQNAVDGGSDWSAFVSPASAPANKGSKDDTDDFFASLMTDLNKDMDSSNKSSPRGRSTSSGGASSKSDEDDFFASLMSEISDEPKEVKEEKKSSNGPLSPSSEDDFFSSLETELEISLSAEPVSSTSTSEDDFLPPVENNIRGSKPPSRAPKPPSRAPRKAAALSQDEGDFFASLEAELGSVSDGKPETRGASRDQDDFFAGLEAELSKELAAPTTKSTGSSENEVPANGVQKADGGDFFDMLEADVSLFGGFVAELSQEPEAPTTKSTGSSSKPKASIAEARPSSTPAPTDLSKLTVPALKGILKERGMKVSGNKAELLVRLSQ
jgi:hypothetical protein